MKKIIILIFSVLFVCCTFVSCGDSADSEDADDVNTGGVDEIIHGQIYLYGESHGVEKIMEKESELWREYYDNENMRHLFVELSYYMAEFLNIWMKSDSDDILEELYNDWAGTAVYVPYTKEFYKMIKRDCPETIFHGTDVGHQSSGERYLKYLEANNLKDSEQYLLAQENFEQGKRYYGDYINRDHAYRENMLAENFIREFDKLNGESIMGIYGSAHTGLDAMDYSTKSAPCMANQLKQHYGDIVHSESLTYLVKNIDPYRVDIIEIDGKEYEASYFGKEDLTALSAEYISREFWRVENAYDDFKDKPKNLRVLPYHNFPMLIESGQVFIVDYVKTDGSVERMYVRSDGNTWNDLPTAEGFDPEYNESVMFNDIDDLDFSDLADMVFIFASGAGAWSTIVEIFSDGTFSGYYHDSEAGSTGPDYPNGTRYHCSFSGKFSSLIKTGDYEYSMKCESITQEGEPDDIEIEDGIKYIITATPYGFDDADIFMLYLPGKKISDLPEEIFWWSKAPRAINFEKIEVLDCWGLYSIEGVGFIFTGK